MSNTDTALTSLYLDCTCGASGDMIVASLLDLGASEEKLRQALSSLPVADEFDIEISKKAVSALDALDFSVVLHGVDTHDHDMKYLHAHENEHIHEHTHDSDHGHNHDHGHEHDHDHSYDHDHSFVEKSSHAHTHTHTHTHRHLPEILDIIRAANLTPGAQNIAERCFWILAQAEAKAHGIPAAEVGFHEVGALDSIVDIVSAAVLIDDLSPQSVFATPLPDGSGTVRCQHGIMPVPVPAVRNICLDHHIPFAHMDVKGELVTPTGAALIAALEPAFELPEHYIVSATGQGAGKRSYEIPSLMRASLITTKAVVGVKDADNLLDNILCDTVIKLECDIDDATSEDLGYAAHALMSIGALEVHWIPIFTKKGRPAYQLQVLCTPAQKSQVEECIFSETTTLGIRFQKMSRHILRRESKVADTPYGDIRIKKVMRPNNEYSVKPEVDDLIAAAQKQGCSLFSMRRLISPYLEKFISASDSSMSDSSTSDNAASAVSASNCNEQVKSPVS